MKTKCFIIASSDDRVHLLKKCIDCAKKSRYSDCDFFLYFQGKNRDFDISFFSEIIWDNQLRGVFTPRYELMKRYGRNYDYIIIIDDDLFLNPNTSYENSIAFCGANNHVGAVALTHTKNAVKNEIRCVSGTSEYFNVCGGLVLPKRSVNLILEYFKDKEKDYTEDVFWLLLYVKGFELYKDYTSYSTHIANRKTVNGELSGYNKMRLEKPHVPILTEWFDSKKEIIDNGLSCRWKLKEMKDINQNGINERVRNRRAMTNNEIG